MIIDPPFKRLYHDDASLVKFPLALGYLSGAVLKWTDWEVQACNADFNPNRKAISLDNVTRIREGMARYLRTLEDPAAPVWAEIRSAITEFGPGVVGISSKTQNFPSAMRVARIAKEHDPHTLVVLGGPHATLSTRAALDCPDIDVAVLGEGEMTLAELLKARENGAPLSEVAGLAYRQDGRKVFTPPRTNMPDLDELPFPAEAAPRVLRDYASYPAEAFGYVFSARGCPYACTFCESKAIWTRTTRWRSTEETLRDTLAAIEKINADNIMLGIFTPYPGSELFQVCKELGVVDDDFDITIYNHQSPENCFTAYISPERFKVTGPGGGLGCRAQKPSRPVAPGSPDAAPARLPSHEADGTAVPPHPHGVVFEWTETGRLQALAPAVPEEGARRGLP